VVSNELLSFLKSLKKENKQHIIIIPDNYYNWFDEYEDYFMFYPDFDIFPFENLDVSPNIKAQRIKVLYSLIKKEQISILTTLSSLCRFTIPMKDFLIKKYKVNDDLDLFTDELYKFGYLLTEEVNSPGEYAKRGFVRDIFVPIYEEPIRIELFDTQIDRITLFDTFSQRSINKLEEFEIVPGSEIQKFNNNIDIFQERIMRFFSDTNEFDISIDIFNSIPGIFYKDKNTILSYLNRDCDIYIVNKQEVIKSFVEKERENLEMCDNDLKKRIYKAYSGHTLEILNKIEYKEIDLKLEKVYFKKSKKEDNRIDFIPLLDWEDLKEGDLVVHEDYGVGIYLGVNKVETNLGLREYITLEYANNAKVYVPVGRLDKLSKYIGDSTTVTISSLNGKKWKATKKKVNEEIRKKIKELLQIYVLRENQQGIQLFGDKELEDKFRESFPYIETPDQERSIREILEDLESPKPMDRLLAGDSGFGKTEVAMRAAFRTVVSNYQVLLLAPTTILASQHYESFKERMEPFGVKIELLTRHKTSKEKEIIFEKIKNGEIDIIIGTHALLSDLLQIRRLGLVIIDEEQRFGVMQKEKFKKLGEGINFLMMSATPIPRTLYMSISGLREISTISTPPLGRLPIQTFVGKYSDKLVRTAVLREKARGGQIIYIHNRIQELENIYKKLQNLIPEVKIGLVHGNSHKNDFIKTMNDFYAGKIDLLFSTTILENGIDIPNANTLIVDDAERYGIAQLYQLKGRVGRSNKRAFAYFLYKKELTPEAKKRLEAIKQYNEPGSGLKSSLRDMEIRGYGDLLGIEQKGHINSVGLHLYKEMLNKALVEYGIKEIEEHTRPLSYTEIKGIKGSIVIPEEYVPNSIERMRIYRRIAVSRTPEEVEDIKKEVRDRYGKLPQEVERLFKYAIIRVKANMEGIKEIEIGDSFITFKFSDDVKPSIDKFNKYSRRAFYYPNSQELIAYGPKDDIEYMENIFS
jgi:transcription-repair coupling factor (superfamily II helicase)